MQIILKYHKVKIFSLSEKVVCRIQFMEISKRSPERKFDMELDVELLLRNFHKTNIQTFFLYWNDLSIVTDFRGILIEFSWNYMTFYIGFFK